MSADDIQTITGLRISSKVFTQWINLIKHNGIIDHKYYCVDLLPLGLAGYIYYNNLDNIATICMLIKYRDDIDIFKLLSDFTDIKSQLLYQSAFKDIKNANIDCHFDIIFDGYEVIDIFSEISDSQLFQLTKIIQYNYILDDNDILSHTD
jgi:hypothetical protein